MAVNVLKHQAAKGVLDDRARKGSRRAGMAELQRQARRRELIAAAGKMFDRIERWDPRIADILVESGVVNSPWMIETLAGLWTHKYSKLRAESGA